MTTDFALLTTRLAEAWAFRAAVAILIVLAMWRVAAWARTSFERATTRTQADANVRLLAGRLIFGTVIVLGIVWALDLVGLDRPGIVATFGAAGLALSLAAQDILKSFFAGLYLLFERPFLIGDEIQVKDYIGVVEEVGFRATTMRTSDNVRLVVPNAIIFSEVVSNRAQRIPPVEPTPLRSEDVRSEEVRRPGSAD
ncbi:MAG: small conductance mechanosensitive channel [Chloroflexota bacterium]|nr:small conductance mechanosensitive channel [Chloroflexota bacterium]